MKIKDIRTALTALVQDILPGMEVVRTDISRPVRRPACKIDVLPVEYAAACAGARERTADADIWYYPKNAERPRDECDAVSDRLAGALMDGFACGGIWLTPEDGVSFTQTDGVLVCQFGLAWLEADAGTDGEPMEDFTYNGEEMTG